VITGKENPISPTSIIRIASSGDADAMMALLAKGADVDQRSRGGHTALMVAAIFSHVDIARLLLAAGADVQLQDNLGLTAMDWANRRGSWDVAQLLSNASLAEMKPSSKSVSGKLAQLKVGNNRLNHRAESQTAPQKDTVPDTEEQMNTRDALKDREAEDVATSSLEREDMTSSSTGTTHSRAEETDTSATGTTASRNSDAVRFMKFHKQIMAAQARRKAEDAQLKSKETPRPLPTEANIARRLDPKVSDEQQVTKGERESRENEDRPAAIQPALIAATIQHLRLQESDQTAEHEVPAKFDSPALIELERSLDSNDPDTTLDRVPAEMSVRPALFEPTTRESLNPAPVKRCPQCNTAYENPLVKYCSYDAAKLVSADGPLFNNSAARDWSRQTLLVLVALIAVLGASLGYLINNYRSREIVSSAPIAAISNPPIETQTEQPEITRNDSPLVSGTLRGMEVNVPEPEYPAKARAEGVSGTVTVRVQVNKKGRVILARSSGGDRRLRSAAVNAAQRATFSAEKLAVHGRAVSGTITYTFAAQTGSPATIETPVAAQTTSQSPTESSPSNEGEDSPVVGGPLVGSESNLPRPDYPKNARTKGIQGTITVVVRVNRAGKVISWRTLEGDSQLRAAALKSAKKATFSPAKLPGKGEVVGTITYNFR